MPSRLSLIVLLFAVSPLFAANGSAPTATPGPCPADAGWSEPTRPAHIFANTWYVGTCTISAILVTSPKGHILIDAATDAAAPAIEANIRALGFRLADIRYLVNSHEHYDHIGGLARLQHDTGATVVAREPAATALERGSNDETDPQSGILEGFPAVAHVRRIADGESVTLGDLRLTAHATAGHTAGSTSWTWNACEGETCHTLVYADSLTAVSRDSYRFSDHDDVVAAFRAAFETVAGLPCDILMTPHPGASGLLARIGPAATEALVDAGACKRYADSAATRLDARLARERGQATP